MIVSIYKLEERKLKKTLLIVGMVSTQFLTQLYAGGDIFPNEIKKDSLPSVNYESDESNFYIIAKGMILLGDTVNHEDAILDGYRSIGLGIDLGYRLGYGFAVEYDFSYSQNTVIEKLDEKIERDTGEYYTSSLDLVYTQEVTKNVGIFGKVGYEYEWETIPKYEIDNQNSDFVFGVGIETEVNKDYKLIAEYEHPMIEGPHGDTVFAGVMYDF